MRRLSILFLFVVTAGAQRGPAELARWQHEARAVTIIRDDWGIPHIYGKTDADAVFGMIYAQAEDDFNRVETNYINAMGRLAEAEGESAIYQDLRMKLFINPDSLRAQYARSPAWLKSLMNAWADGLNFFLYKHPEVKPRLITRFEPWMALSFTEGSIGGDIERIDLRQLQAFYDSTTGPTTSSDDDDPGGSNGFAIAPSNTLNHHALLLINPHTSFFFRAELQVVSEQGLDAYGAVTWGQIFVYQGFNDRVGWMHTSSGVDAIDEYLETVAKKGNRYFYRYGSAERPMTVATITVPYNTPGGMARKTFTVYRTHHGPIVRHIGDRWVSIRLMQDPIHALMQSYSRTKAKSYQAFRKTMELHTNSSNNTVYADAAGNIAYFHGNFIPRRDTSFDWTRPVDGSNPATEWQGLLSVDETPHLLNPASGWLYNSNDAPWWAAGGGASSPRKEDYPAYVQTGGGTARGRHTVRVLQNTKDFTLESLRGTAAGVDPGLGQFPGGRFAQDESRGAYRAVTELGPALVCGVDSDVSCGLLGRAARRPIGARRREGTRRSRRPAHRRLRHLENAVGRDQSLSTAHRRHRPSIHRLRAEHPGAVHVRALGIAGRIRRPPISGNEAMVWDLRQQLRRGRGVRRQRAGESGDRGWGEWSSRYAALQ